MLDGFDRHDGCHDFGEAGDFTFIALAEAQVPAGSRIVKTPAATGDVWVEENIPKQLAG